jgi:hypothetical protein
MRPRSCLQIGHFRGRSRLWWLRASTIERFQPRFHASAQQLAPAVPEVRPVSYASAFTLLAGSAGFENAEPGIGYFAVITGAIAERFIEHGEEERMEAVEADAPEDLRVQLDNLPGRARELVAEFEAFAREASSRVRVAASAGSSRPRSVEPTGVRLREMGRAPDQLI